MAFDRLHPASGPFFIAPGESYVVWLRRGVRRTRDGDLGSDNYGAQWIMANPLPGQPQRPGRLTVSNMTKVRDYIICRVTINGGAPEYSCVEPARHLL